MTDWVRLWHDMPTDPKWRTIARKSKQRVGDVIAVFNFLMVNASGNATERGKVVGFDCEDVATALDLDESDVEAIIAAMRGKVLNENDCLSGWEKRQVTCGHGSNDAITKSYLYVIANSSSREVKIGTSRNPWARSKDLQTGGTGKTTVVATFAGVRADETEAHRILAKFRKAGEWFDLPSEIHQFLVFAHEKKQSAPDMISELRSLLLSNYRSYEDTETETEKKKKEGGYAFCGKIVRLTPADFARWESSFPSIDLTAALQTRDDWLAGQDEAARAKWFNSTSSWLAKRQQQSKADAKRELEYVYPVT